MKKAEFMDVKFDDYVPNQKDDGETLAYDVIFGDDSPVPETLCDETVVREFGQERRRILDEQLSTGILSKSEYEFACHDLRIRLERMLNALNN